MISAIQASLISIVIAYIFAFITGVSMAICANLSNLVRKIIVPVINVMRPVSAIALFPVIVRYVGIGLWARVVVLMWITLPVVLLNTLHDLEVIEAEVLDAARLDASNYQIMGYIKLPVIKLSLLATANVTLATTIMGLTAAEMLGASDGVGFKILEAAHSFNSRQMWLYILVMSVMGFVMSYGVQTLYKKQKEKQ